MAFLVIPPVDPGRREYRIKVRRLGDSWTNKVLGVVALQKKRARHLECLVRVPGHDSTRARVSR